MSVYGGKFEKTSCKNCWKGEKKLRVVNHSLSLPGFTEMTAHNQPVFHWPEFVCCAAFIFFTMRATAVRKNIICLRSCDYFRLD